jgi:hypothetical protein
MKFLIDECLQTSLIFLAHDAGHLCEHVNFSALEATKLLDKRSGKLIYQATGEPLQAWLTSAETSNPE